ncbi:MAG TPA: YggT family protein [Gammaproteobacteria bacterium]|nr:YggT family protein [Gammaproteobacteria bacterium]
MGYFSEAGTFLIGVAFGLYILLVMLRLVLQTARADFRNPVSQFVYRATQPVLAPLRRVVPGWGGLDWALILLLVVLQFLELLLTNMITGQTLHPLVLLVVALGKLVKLLITIYTVTIIVQAILSWVQTGYHPVTALLWQINEPVLRPFRNLLPAMGGVDLSPLLALVVLNLVSMAIPYLQAALLRLLL